MSNAEVDPVSFTREQLRTGNAVELLVETRKGKKRFMLIPSVCWRGLHQELLIVLEGYSAVFYKGGSLNRFVLVSNGYPIDLAVKVAAFIESVMLPKCRIRLRPPNNVPLLGAPTKQ